MKVAEGEEHRVVSRRADHIRDATADLAGADPCDRSFSGRPAGDWTGGDRPRVGAGGGDPRPGGEDQLKLTSLQKKNAWSMCEACQIVKTT
ncbi:hypothetical protein GCM10010151_15810 [Actinoallomurus spadix]|uniref:Uncharacterized protein n=1 Tax=Actinoallomurus spadix TaxID=79912 RepID=A0ABP3FUU4_9ACTN